MSRGPPPRLWFICPPAAFAIWVRDSVEPLLEDDQRRGHDLDEDEMDTDHDDGVGEGHRDRGDIQPVIPVDDALDEHAVDLEEYR